MYLVVTIKVAKKVENVDKTSFFQLGKTPAKFFLERFKIFRRPSLSPILLIRIYPDKFG